MEKTFRFNSIAEFHQFCNLPAAEHPLISLIDYSQVNYPVNENELQWIQTFYSIGLKRNVNAKFNYGQQVYDFDSGVLTFVSPLQFLRIEMNPEVDVEASGWLLLIHPDFLFGTPLSKKIKTYDYFQYSANEALFLSEKEENCIVDLLKSIEREYQSNIDRFSQELIISQLDQLLIYSEPFYEPQFLTRKKTNIELVEALERLLSNYFRSGQGLENGVPTVSAIADQLHISANYLGSILRLYTKQNTQQHIQHKLMEYAKEKLSTTERSVSEIAYELGFEHPQSFSKFFKNKTNQSPLQFRNSFN